MNDDLSVGARLVLQDVLDALQQAEELGGTEGGDDYIRLMERVAAECQRRVDAANALPWRASR